MGSSTLESGTYDVFIRDVVTGNIIKRPGVVLLKETEDFIVFFNPHRNCEEAFRKADIIRIDRPLNKGSKEEGV